jgi:pimeloyl-ACP methyl ester carboxylesterase
MNQSVTVEPVFSEIPTVENESVMTDSFLKAFRNALALSNLAIDEELKYRNVTIYEKDHMHEVYTTTAKDLPHLVVLHGFAGTSLTFIRMFEHLRTHFQVHALDTFGVGLSSRGNWREDMTSEEVSNYYVDAIEEWRKQVGISSFVLAGHSFGGYISTLYFERYADRVDHLMLLSPAGTARFTDEEKTNHVKGLGFLLGTFLHKLYDLSLRPAKIMDTFWIGDKFINAAL